MLRKWPLPAVIKTVACQMKLELARGVLNKLCIPGAVQHHKILGLDSSPAADGSLSHPRLGRGGDETSGRTLGVFAKVNCNDSLHELQLLTIGVDEDPLRLVGSQIVSIPNRQFGLEKRQHVATNLAQNVLVSSDSPTLPLRRGKLLADMVAPIGVRRCLKQLAVMRSVMRQ